MVYISGKITGTTDYMERFEIAEKMLTAKGYSVINPAKVNSNLPEEHMTHEGYMVVSIALLSLCDTIYMLEGYEDSAGAMEELEYATEHGIKIL